MSDHAPQDELRARVAEIESRRVAPGEIARWFWPWVLAGVLVAIFLAGLWSASRAVDDGAYVVGLVAAALALAGLAWELDAALGGRSSDLFVSLLVDDADSLVILVALMTALALGGLVVAAHAASVAVAGAGYGLCVFAVIFIFADLKHYFDRRDRRPH
ncbi:MAG TPA: hypothetical protein VNF99_04315 [Stellaceae bacterium]|nr:hypothetical protein [Stellaceae bacterium]